MQQYYYVQRGEQQFGPYLSEALLDYVSQGNIVLTDLVFMEDSQSWISLDQTPLIQNLFGIGVKAADPVRTAPETETSSLPEVPKRPMEIQPELNVEMIEDVSLSPKDKPSVHETTPVETAPLASAAPERAHESFASEDSSSFDLTFTEGVASVEISHSTRGQLKVEVKSDVGTRTEPVSIEIQAARAVRISLTCDETCTVGGQASVLVHALDAFGNLDSQCDAELSIKYSSSAMGVSRIQLKNGVGTFAVTNERATVSSFVVAGSGPWSDLESADGAIEFVAGPAVQFEILAPPVINAGSVSRIQIRAKDRFGNQTSHVESEVKLAIQHFVS